jgi:malate dehydrogenase
LSRRVAIIGAAGTLGSCAAFTLAFQGICDELILIPHQRENIVRLYQIDLESALTGLNDTKVRVGCNEDISEADVVLVCAGPRWRQVSSRMEWLEDALPVTQQVAEVLRQYCTKAVVINQTNPVDPTTWLLQRLSGLPRERILGYSFNDTLRFRGLLAQNLNVSSTVIDALVVGEHGSHQVLLFSSVRIHGQPYRVSDQTRNAILAEIPKIVPRLETLGQGRMVGWTCSVGAAAQIGAVLDDTSKVFPCSVVLQGEYGRHNLSATVPVRLGRTGVQEFMPMRLEPNEKQQLEDCFDYLHSTVQLLEQRFPVIRSSTAAGH